MGASQQLLRRSGSFPTTAQEEEWELPNYCPGGGVGVSQLLPRRTSGSFPAAAREEEWELPNHCLEGRELPNYCPRVGVGDFPAAAQEEEEEWELPSYRSRRGVGASQQLLRRRDGSFAFTANDEDWELSNYCPRIV